MEFDVKPASIGSGGYCLVGVKMTPDVFLKCNSPSALVYWNITFTFTHTHTDTFHAVWCNDEPCNQACQV